MRNGAWGVRRDADAKTATPGWWFALHQLSVTVPGQHRRLVTATGGACCYAAYT